MKRIARRVPATVVVLGFTVAGLLAAAAPAQAAGPANAAGTTTSTAYAGWFRPLPYPQAATMTFTLTVLAVDCGRPGTAPLRVAGGVSGVSGDAAAGAFGELTATCTGGGAAYVARAIVTGAAPGRALAVTPGDVVTVSSQVTRAREAVVTVSAGAARSRASGSFGASGASLRVLAADAPAFAPARFADVRVNGRPLGSLDPTAVTQVRSGAPVAEPTAWTGGGLVTGIRDRR